MNRTLYIALTARFHDSELHPDDRDATGLYRIEGIDAGADDSSAASRSMNAFHEQIPLSHPDHFDIAVLDRTQMAVLCDTDDPSPGDLTLSIVKESDLLPGWASHLIE